MELLKQPPAMKSMKLPAEWFTGDAYADVILRGEGIALVRSRGGHCTAVDERRADKTLPRP
ncbi:hypothetical protein ACFXPN_43380 [Streptomyces griseorubiginosus]|uniref:hypothetical protein n=1 Tax=Streptomyces griseorubiginosus TaxID=67304 RepID=UPI00369AC717